MQTNQNQTIDQLNSFLRGELSAVETYRQALGSTESVPHRSTLELCARSHFVVLVRGATSGGQ